jgi:hypothetical protein
LGLLQTKITLPSVATGFDVGFAVIDVQVTCRKYYKDMFHPIRTIILKIETFLIFLTKKGILVIVT